MSRNENAKFFKMDTHIHKQTWLSNSGGGSGDGKCNMQKQENNASRMRMDICSAIPIFRNRLPSLPFK